MGTVSCMDRRLASAAQDARGVIVGAYRTSANVFLEGFSGLCTVLAPTSDDGPGGIVLASAPFRPFGHFLSPGTPVRFVEGIMTTGEFKLDAREARLFDCSLVDDGWRAEPEEAREMACLLRAALTSRRRSRLDDSLRRFARSRMESLGDALLNGSGDDVERAAGALVGLGEGLTPSGDDHLAGCLAALRFALGPQGTLALAVSRGISGSLENTTWVAASMLTSAREGRFRGVVRELLVALRTQSEGSVRKRLDRLLEVGATSGFDMAGGILAGLRTVSMIGKR